MKNIALLFILLFQISALAGEAALVIVDMQPDFAKSVKFLDQYHGNQQKLDAVLENQIDAIRRAKRFKAAILLVEYATVKESFEVLLDELEGYSRAVIVRKTRDSLFDSLNENFELTRSILKAWDVDKLVIMGANGGACVDATIRLGIENGYIIYAYANGIVDFNSEFITFPYLYGDEFEETLSPDSDGNMAHQPDRFFEFENAREMDRLFYKGLGGLRRP